MDYKKLENISVSVPKIFEFLGLECNNEVMEKATRVGEARVGSSFVQQYGQNGSGKKDEVQRVIAPVLRERVDSWN